MRFIIRPSRSVSGTFSEFAQAAVLMTGSRHKKEFIMQRSVLTRIRRLSGVFSLTGAMLVSASASAAIFRVDPTAPAGGNGSGWGSSALNNLPAALALAGPGDDIWVAQGVLKPTLRLDAADPRSATFQLENGLKIWGGFPTGGGNNTFEARDPLAFPTTLSGDIGTVGVDTDNAYRVVYSPSGITESTRLDGFIITKGNGDGGSRTLPLTDRGGGLLVNQSRPLIVRCQFIANKALRGGGAFLA
jgi:hypothetical protein